MGQIVPDVVERYLSALNRFGEYNERLNTHSELMTVTLPLRDGVAISLKTPPESRPTR
jgi:hypothetical protein